MNAWMLKFLSWLYDCCGISYYDHYYGVVAALIIFLTVIIVITHLVYVIIGHPFKEKTFESPLLLWRKYLIATLILFALSFISYSIIQTRNEAERSYKSTITYTEKYLSVKVGDKIVDPTTNLMYECMLMGDGEYYLVSHRYSSVKSNYYVDARPVRKLQYLQYLEALKKVPKWWGGEDRTSTMRKTITCSK